MLGHSALAALQSVGARWLTGNDYSGLFFSPPSSIFFIERVLKSRGPLSAISDFSGGGAIQEVSECPGADRLVFSFRMTLFKIHLHNVSYLLAVKDA